MSRFITNVLKLVSGSVIAQALGILLVPIVTRLYSPGDFGVFQLLLAISGILAVLSCLSYQLAIMLPKEDEESANIVSLCFILICITSAISGGVFILLSGWVGMVLNTPEISQYLIFLPVVVFLNGLFVVINYWLSRRVRFGAVATAQVANSVLSKAVQIGVGIGAASPVGLILGQIAGYGAALLVMARGVREDLSLFRAVSPHRIKLLAKRYRRFPLFTSWSTVANSVSLQVAPLMLAAFFSPVVVGFYGMANTVINMPMSLIGSATGQVFFQKASDEKNRTGSVKSVVREVHQRLVSIGIFPIMVLMIIGEELFSFVLGAEWATAGEYARILAPWLLLVFIASPLSTIFSVLERQTVDLSFNILILFSRIAVLYVGGIYGNPVITLILFSLTGVIFWGWMNLYILKISGVAYRTGLQDFLRFFLVALVVALPLIVVKYLALPLYILFIVAGIVTCIYYAVVISGDYILKKEIMGILQEVRP
ncbi:MAG TPA: oligosaccharide flippase family protein [Methanothrix sp.]|nr:oligosaccharide flippase family protein [Methanothrix sp.]